MSHIKPIRSDTDHEAALARLDELMDAEAGTVEADELAVLAELIETYETTRYPIELPSPIDAIRFRMEQMGMAARNLEPFIGSRGKVSSVLSGKAPLTLPMIRALNKHLGIPAEVLLNDSRDDSLDDGEAINAAAIDWSRFPLHELMKRDWIPKVSNAKAKAEELLGDLVASAGGLQAVPAPLWRRNDAMRQNAKTDVYALTAWCLKAVSIARTEALAGTFDPGSVDLDFMTHVAKLSATPDGPVRAKEVLASKGVHLVCVRHLPKTYLDGAALRVPDDAPPIVALSLRYDRLDNFWFSLLHELAHIARHFDGEVEAFVDDFSLCEVASRKEDVREVEADEWANEALIPRSEWLDSELQTRASYAKILAFSNHIGVHPAIVAGRVRYETRNFRAFAPLLGKGEVRSQLEFAA